MNTKLYFFMATTCFLFTVTTASAGNKNRNINIPAEKTSRVVTDTPYLASVKIYRTGIKDTPYLCITAAPSTVYSEVEQALAGERGSFKVNIEFYSERGVLIRNEIYFIKTGEEINAPRTK